MKKILFLTTLFPIAVLAQNPASEMLQPIPGLYFGGGYGWFNSVNADDKFSGNPKQADFFSAFGGMTFMQVFRAEAEVIHMRADNFHDINPSETRLSALMFNGYAGLPIKYIRPYVGAGIGFGWMNINYPNEPIENSGLQGSSVIQGMLGVDIDIPQSPIKISAEWRTLFANQHEKNDDDDDSEDRMSLHSNLFQVKLRYQF